MISISDYQGTNIEKAFGIDENTHLTPELIKQALDQKLEKGLIDQPLYDKAVEQLNGLIEKAGKGEGSRGGHIIGHTKSGKPVYKTQAAGRNSYEKFSAQDHKDAAELHRKVAEDHHTKSSIGYSTYAKTHHASMRDWHHDTAQAHDIKANKQGKQEHEASLSADEKKIIAEQKKKQIGEHEESHAFHTRMANQMKQEFDNEKSSSIKKLMKEHIDAHESKARHHKSEKERLEKE